MPHTCLDNHVRFCCPYHLLRRDYVGRKLDDGDAHPAPKIGVVVLVGGMEHIDCVSEEVLILCKSQCLPALFFFKCCAIVYDTQDSLRICRLLGKDGHV